MASKNTTISLQLITHSLQLIKQHPRILLWPVPNSIFTLLIVALISHPIIERISNTANIPFNKHYFEIIAILVIAMIGKNIVHFISNKLSYCQIMAIRNTQQNNHANNIDSKKIYKPLRKAWKKILLLHLIFTFAGGFLAIGNRIKYLYCILFNKTPPINNTLVARLMPLCIMFEPNIAFLDVFKTTSKRMQLAWGGSNMTGNSASFLIDFMYLVISLTPALLGYVFAKDNLFVFHASIALTGLFFIITSVLHHACHMITTIELYIYSKNQHEPSQAHLNLHQAYILIKTKNTSC